MSQGLKDQRTSVYRVDPESPADPALPVLRTEELMLNMGPQHPATHGVLKVVMDLEGERIVKATPVMGYLHRGVEKLAEHGTYHQFIPHTDRLDYVCAMYNNFSYVRAVEKLIDLPVPERAEYLRTIVAEVQRIIGHQFWLGTQALDLGAMTVFFYTFRDREILLDWFDRLCGARLTTSWYRIGGVERDLSPDLVEAMYEYLDYFPPKIDEYMTFLEKNRIWLARTKGVAVISAEDAISFGMSGPPLRGSGVDYDLRKYEPYAAYDKVEWKVPVGVNGDTYDRYWIRMEEMRESVKILRQCIKDIPGGGINVDDGKIVLPTKEKVMTNMEELIHQFMIVTQGQDAPAGEVYFGAENPKGELGFYIHSLGGGTPHRLKIRAPSFVNLSILSHLLPGHMMSDVVAILGSLDFVMGECDR